MMTMTNKGLRRLTFSLHALMVVGFCLAILKVGWDETRRARVYSEREKEYLGTLLECERRLDEVELLFAKCLRDSSDERFQLEFERAAVALAEAMARLNRREKRRVDRSLFSSSGVLDEARRLVVLAVASRRDRRRPGYEARALIDENERVVIDVLEALNRKTRELARVELSHAEMWRRRSFFYFQRLQHVLVVFFVMTVLFGVAASSLFGYFLRRSLRALSAGSREISAGNLDFRFEEPRDDEIGEVMRDYNRMVEKLSGQRNALRQANVELTRKTEALIEAHQHKDRFLANMSHELRTPLNSVIGFAELIAHRVEAIPPEKPRRYAGRILDASEHLLALISDLLRISKIDAGVLKPVINDFDMVDCVREALGMLAPTAERKGLEVEVNLPDALPIRADKRLLRQIVINLLDNAIKFTNEGVVSISLAAAGTECRIVVGDTGIGIGDEDQTMIFKDFHRVETGLTSNYEGVGLGLTLSKRLVELHGGAIMVSSALNEGTEFTVLLPINIEMESRKEP